MSELPRRLTMRRDVSGNPSIFDDGGIVTIGHTGASELIAELVRRYNAHDALVARAREPEAAAGREVRDNWTDRE